MKFTAFGDYLIVKPDVAKTASEGGIILPESSLKAPPWGTVISTNDPDLQDKKIYYSAYAGDVVEIDDVKYLILHKSDIRAFVED